MIKIIAIDLDGTLLNSNKVVSNENKRVLRRKEKDGVHIILASGKPHAYVKKIAREIGLKNNTFCISCNGAYIHKLSSDKPYKKFLLGKKDYNEILGFYNKFNVDVYALTEEFIHSPSYIISHGAIYESYTTKINIKYFPVSDLDDSSGIPKICLFGDADYLDYLKEKTSHKLSKKYNIMRCDDRFIDIISKKTSKGYALNILKDKLKSEINEVMCIGDNENDASMIPFSGIGIAMGNASDELKSIADFITSSNDEDGVAKAILDYT